MECYRGKPRNCPYKLVGVSLSAQFRDQEKVLLFSLQLKKPPFRSWKADFSAENLLIQDRISFPETTSRDIYQPKGQTGFIFRFCLASDVMINPIACNENIHGPFSETWLTNSIASLVPYRYSYSPPSTKEFFSNFSTIFGYSTP